MRHSAALLLVLLSSPFGGAHAATAEAQQVLGAAPYGAPPEQRVRAAARAIAIEKASPEPDIHFLLFAMLAQAEALGDDSSDGLRHAPAADKRKAIALAKEALQLVGPAEGWLEEASKKTVILGPPPKYCEYELLSGIARWTWGLYGQDWEAFLEAHAPKNLEPSNAPIVSWEDQRESRALARDAETYVKRAMRMETSDPRLLYQPAAEERLASRKLLLDIYWRQHQWRDAMVAALDLHAFLYADNYLQGAQSPVDREHVMGQLRALPANYAITHSALQPGDADLFFGVLQALATDEDTISFDRLAARASLRSPRAAERLRTFQKLVDDYRDQERQAFGDALKGVYDSHSRQLVVMREEAKRQWTELVKLSPRVARLTQPSLLTIAEIQKRLAKDEALLLLHVHALGTITAVVTPMQATYAQGPMDAGRLIARIVALRRSVDMSRVRKIDEVPVFDGAAASDLYQALIAPAAASLGGVRHLYVVPDQPLRSLPLSMLLTAPARVDPKHYGALPFLARKYAVTVLPTVSSLRAGDLPARADSDGKPMIAFADPVLDTPGARPELRGLDPLPETADEVRNVARALKADSSELHIGADATKSLVKKSLLDRYRVVYFATHALLPHEAQNIDQPAIVLSAPQRPSPEDDGVLTMDEILGLRLDADWVVLSACNTVGPATRGLSGLSKAFMFAGARALLVSNWAVETTTTSRLMSALFREYYGDPSMGRAEALRRAMVAAMDHPAAPIFGHPAFWSAFVVIGDDGREPVAKPMKAGL